MTDMKLPKGHGGFSIAGAQYKPNKQGIVEDVDPAHFAEAQLHGAKIVGEEPAAEDDGDDKPLSAMKLGELQDAFRKRFVGMEPGDANKAAIIDAIEKGWGVFGIGELRGAYKSRFNTEAPAELKKPDLIEALDAPDED